MASELQQMLRSLCSSTEWTYAVFWRLKPRPRMVLAWDDAYYDNCGKDDLSQVNCSTEVVDHFGSFGDLHDPLGLALAKLSNYVYSLGEGIIGQVAITGKHKWITFDDYVKNSDWSFKFQDLDAWQTQFLAGIKTVFIAAVPYGVLQVGSLQKIDEDMELVTHIRDAFHSLHDVSLQHQSTAIVEEKSNLDHRCYVPESNLGPYLQKVIATNTTPSNVSLPIEAFGVDLPCIPPGISNFSTCEGFDADSLDTNWSRPLQISQPSKELQKDHAKKLDTEVGLNYTEMSSTSMRFSTISELHEALGPAFHNKSNLSDTKEQKVEAPSVKVLEQINNSKCTNEFGSDHLLDAVVAKACHTCFDDRSEKSFSESRDYPLSTRTMSGPGSFSKLTINSEDYSIDKQPHMDEDCLQSSERSLGICSSAISSAYPSSGVEAAGRSLETAKNGRKRSRPGESRRPRPRDRQLIQDRLKELRELVPNGSKCSIDSLLEQTIKHMLFLQSITKHADNLNQCTESKRFRHSEMTMMGSSNSEQGSSWAVDVGSHLKVHSIMVENLSTNGQLLVEMLCEDCSHFLEIAEAMRSLGLTILKGATDVHGDKIWICFVIEGQKNVSLHRMDILWSLVQVLQLKSASETA